MESDFTIYVQRFRMIILGSIPYIASSKIDGIILHVLQHDIFLTRPDLHIVSIETLARKVDGFYL